ncbi:phage/plasmid primase, P4 family [Nitrospinota bacterium]
MTSLSKEAIDFLEPHLAAAQKVGGAIYLAFIVPDGRTTQQLVTTREEARDTLRKFSKGRNSYFSPGIREAKAKNPFLKSSVIALSAIIADQDFKDINETEAREKIDAIGRKPSALIMTGGGLQASFVFEEPVLVDDPAPFDRVVKDLGAALGGDPGHIGGLYRLPGFLNLPNEKKRKRGRVPILAITEHLNGNRYSFEDFVDLVPLEPKKAAKKVKTDLTQAASKLPVKLTEIIKKKPLSRIARLWRGERIDRGGTKRSGADAALAVEMVRQDFSDEEIAAALKLYPYGKAAERKNLERYVATTIENARGWVEAHPGSFPLTDVGNAARFVHRHGDDLRWVPELKKWLHYDGVHWQIDSDGESQRRAKETAASIYIEAAKTTSDELQKRIASCARRANSLSGLDAIVGLAKSEPGITIPLQRFDADPMLFGVANGVIDLRTGTIRPARCEDYILKRSPVVFDRKAKCPVFRKFLGEIFKGDKELIVYTQRIMGYLLTGSTMEQCFFLFYGGGGNGKTTLLKPIQTLLGDYSRSSTPETFLVKPGRSGANNDIARLAGARLVVTVEIEEGKRFSESIIKLLTGGDRVPARFLFCESFEFVPQFKLIVCANSKPIIRGQNTAIWRRIRVVPFTRTFAPEEQDRELPSKLETELPGILNFALQGALDWQEKGLAEPSIITRAVEGYRSEMDLLGAWINEECITQEKLKGRAQELFNSFTEWAKENGEREMSVRTFGPKMEERGFTRKADKLGNYYAGIDLKKNVHDGYDDLNGA